MPYILLVALCLLVTPLAQAATTSTVAKTQKQDELRDLQGRIGGLKKDIADSEEHHSEASDKLRATEMAISVTNRRLRDLGDNRAALAKEIEALNVQSRKLEAQITAQQLQISDLLYRRYVSGEPDSLALLISGRNPNEVARDQHFLTLLSQAKTQLVADLNDSLAEKKRLTEAVRERNERLVENEKHQQEQKQQLVTQQKERQLVLNGLSEKIKSQRRELETLKRDEKRLAKLIEGLTRLLAQQQEQKKKKPAPPAKKPAKNAPAIKNERVPDADIDSGEFAALRGKLRLPVRGEVVNRFGSPRADGGTTWKGLYIRAAEGSDVKSIAAGQVVFADWLRGFGNLIVIDHGDGYLSVYGNNQALLRESGAQVKAGDTVASVGNSGGNPDSGLYFELRHQGRALDPMKWINLH